VSSDRDTAVDAALIAPASAPDAQGELLAKFFRGLGDPTRLQIIEILIEEGEQNVSQLVKRVGGLQGRISSHLMCLRWCGFVTTERRGKYVYYRVSDERVAELVRLGRDLLVENAQQVLVCQVIR